MTAPIDPRDLAAEETSQRAVDAQREEPREGIKLGLFDGIPDAEYRAAQGLSASEAKVLLGKRPPAPSPALAFGTLVHALVLEPHREDEYQPADAEKIGVKADGTAAAVPTMTVAWKRFVAEAEQSGKTVVAQAEWDTARAMRDAVHSYRSAALILDTCTRREVSGWARHDTGVLVKGRLDLLGSGIVGDLKSTRDADPDKFGWTCTDFLYHVSGANYMDIANAAGEQASVVAFINVEKEPPYRVSVVELADRAVQRGRELMHEACRRYRELGEVALPTFKPKVIDLPPKAYRDADDYTTDIDFEENPS